MAGEANLCTGKAYINQLANERLKAFPSKILLLTGFEAFSINTDFSIWYVDLYIQICNKF